MIQVCDTCSGVVIETEHEATKVIFEQMFNGEKFRYQMWLCPKCVNEKMECCGTGIDDWIGISTGKLIS